MRSASVRKITATGLFAAVIMLCTFLVKLPIGTTGGYIHAGDGVIFIGAWLLGGPLGAVAAGIGSLLADVMAGALAYAIPTLVIKALIAFLYALIVGAQPGAVRIALGSAVGGAVMIAGYFLYEWAAFSMSVALVGVPFNAIQAVGGVVVALVGQVALMRVPKVLRMRTGLR